MQLLILCKGHEGRCTYHGNLIGRSEGFWEVGGVSFCCGGDGGCGAVLLAEGRDEGYSVGGEVEGSVVLL